MFEFLKELGIAGGIKAKRRGENALPSCFADSRCIGKRIRAANLLFPCQNAARI
jgi:hypothetical protein